MTDFVLIGGLWLDGSAWDAVLPELDALGHRGVAVTLPGQGDGSTTASLADQLAAVLTAADALDTSAGPTVVVGHSAAATLAWMVADTRPQQVAKVIMIGGFPSADGATYADFFPIENGAMPFPGWAPFEGPDSADLDQATMARIAAAAIPVPEAVSMATVRLRDTRRFAVPVVVICPEFSPDDAKQWVAAGDVPELAAAEQVEYVDIDSGHWPMFTRPAELARLLAAAAGSPD